jgi:DNA-binding transcriptional LysR family regulator
MQRDRDPSLQALKVFSDVARHRSFSRAAKINDRSQSAASQVVLQLEEWLGVQLIDRSTRPLQLTPLGQRFFEGCQDLLRQFRELEAAIKKAQTEQASTVRVAAIYSVGFRDMSQYVRRFETLQPGVKVQLEYLHPNRVYEEVLAGTADFGLVSFPRKSRELITLPWREEEMLLVCSPRHGLAQNLAVPPRQLAGEKYVAFEKGLAIRRQVDRFLRAQGIRPNVVCEFDNIENIKKAVEIEGVALLPEPTLRREVQAGTLVALPLVGCRLVRPLGIVHRRHHRLTSTAQRFLDLLRQPDEAAAGAAARPAESNGAASAADPSTPEPRGRRNGRAAKKTV